MFRFLFLDKTQKLSSFLYTNEFIFDKIDYIMQEVEMMIYKLSDILFKIILRFIIMANMIFILNKENNEHVYKLAVLYISFIVIILNINHKNRVKILAQSFFVIILGTFVYLLRDSAFFIKVIVEFSLSVFLTELFITTLKLSEILKLFKLSFKEFQEDFEFQKLIKKAAVKIKKK